MQKNINQTEIWAVLTTTSLTLLFVCKTTSDVVKALVWDGPLTCVSPAHVHVTHQSPGIDLWVVHLNALPDQRAVMSSSRVQLATQHTDP